MRELARDVIINSTAEMEVMQLQPKYRKNTGHQTYREQMTCAFKSSEKSLQI